MGNQDTHILSAVTLLIPTFSGGRPGAEMMYMYIKKISEDTILF